MSLLVLALTSTLILKSGDRITIDGAVKEANGVATFRVAGGQLYSMPASEIDRGATRVEAERAAAKPASGVKKLAVSDEKKKQLIAELEKNHSGSPAAKDAVPPKPAPKSAVQKEEEKRDEWAWRRQARAHEEAIRQAQENLDLLLAKIEKLEGEIRGFITLGYKPSQFTWQTTQLAWTKEDVPHAELEVKRAQRAYDEFREDARRQGVLPGWLR